MHQIGPCAANRHGEVFEQSFHRPAHSERIANVKRERRNADGLQRVGQRTLCGRQCHEFKFGSDELRQDGENRTFAPIQRGELKGQQHACDKDAPLYFSTAPNRPFAP